MTVSTSLLQKEIYSHNPMMKGMANYFPCIGTHCLYEGQANGRKRKRGAGGRDKSVCVYAFALTIQEQKTKVSGSIHTHLPFSRLQQPVTPQIT